MTAAGKREPYRVIEKPVGHWCYVVGDPTPEHSGPWRYRWEAQEYADELNSKSARLVLPPNA